ncbi:Poly(A) polymerase I [Patescibacteria group bacterium]|nr:Poly(A) polymerase I [Patescibacteria group bacterium]
MSPATSEADGVNEQNSVTIYSRSEHSISRKQISDNALKVLYRLQKEGFDAYLVGGCVRDLLFGREPKDFDVVTNAEPEEIRKIFRNCRLIGRRFRLAHVHFGHEVIEVATFRAANENAEVLNKEGRIVSDNVYGTIEQDVWRRDFTVNALYYNIKDFSVVDYAGGMLDHQAAMLRLIGDPETRFREDPVRMLRAVRFAVKLGFMIHPDCEKVIPETAPLLAGIPPARLFDETMKLFMSGNALQTFEMLRHYGLFQVLFPLVERSLSVEAQGFPKLLIAKALENSDARMAEGKTVTAYFLFAAFLWDAVQHKARWKQEHGVSDYMAWQEAIHEVLHQQNKSIALPRHISLAMTEVWSLQSKFTHQVGAKPAKLVLHPRFRAAFDFLLLRAETGGADKKLAEWWEVYQHADDNERRKMTSPQRKNNKPRKKNYRRKAKPKATSVES